MENNIEMIGIATQIFLTLAFGVLGPAVVAGLAIWAVSKKNLTIAAR